MIKLDGILYETLEKVTKITNTDYDVMWIDKQEQKGYVFADSLYSALEDLLYEYNILQEKLEDTIQDREENYQLKKIDPYNEYGISEDNFH